MSGNTEQAVYRARRSYRRNVEQKGYAYTVELIDDVAQAVTASCDLIGRAALTPLAIADDGEATWRMMPNRKVMPSRWIVTNPDRDAVAQFDQKILGKLVNPLYRVVLAVLDSDDREMYRVVDPRERVLDQLLLGPDEWAVLDGDRAVAKLAWLPRQSEPVSGVLGRLKRLLSASDLGLVSIGSDHILPAPVTLAMIVLIRELTDASAG